MNSIKNIKTNKIKHIDFNKKLNNLYVYSSFNQVYESSNNKVYLFLLF